MTVKSSARGWRKSGKWLAASLLLLACATTARADDYPNDPLQGFNRAMFAVNEVVDTYAAKPLAQAYDHGVPLPAKVGFGNFFGNVADFWIGVNSALQGKFADAGNDLGRLLINSTIGIFGLFDVASELGLEKHDEDFGQTLAVWGVGDGPYLFWPIIGPRTLRDTAGWGVDSYIDPILSLDPVSRRNSLATLRFIDIRASLLPADKVVEEAAFDKYTYIRDAYLQRRRNQVFDGRPPRLDD